MNHLMMANSSHLYFNVKQSSMKWFVINLSMLGFCLGFLAFLLWRNDFRINNNSEDFIPIISFALLFITFVIGLIRVLPEIKKNKS